MLREPTLSLHPNSVLTQMAEEKKDEKEIFVEGKALCQPKLILLAENPCHKAIFMHSRLIQIPQSAAIDAQKYHSSGYKSHRGR